MQQLTTEHLRALMAEHAPPCLSLYQQTHRRHPENQQDPIRYRNLLKELEASLAGQEAEAVRRLLEPLRALSQDTDFWNHTLEGLAVFGSADAFEVFRLPRAVPRELAIVADSFHVKPLVRMLQSADRYQVLGLNRNEVRLFEGDRDALVEVELAEGVPRTIEDALGAELTEPHLTVGTYGLGPGGAGSAHGAPSMHHGHGGRKDEVQTDAVRFFRAVDRAILEHHSRPSGLPLMLAALPEHHSVFRDVSHNPFLMAEGIPLDPASIPAERLREEAWKKLEPRYLERLAGLKDAFEESRARQLGSEDISDVAQAAIAGRVGTLLVEARRQVPGRLDRASGRVEFGTLHDPGMDDLLDDLAELTLKMGGDVVVVPTERMPARSGLAATYRF